MEECPAVQDNKVILNFTFPPDYRELRREELLPVSFSQTRQELRLY